MHFYSITYLLWISYLKIQSNLKYSVLYPSFWLYILYSWYKIFWKYKVYLCWHIFSTISEEKSISWVCEYINLMKSSFKINTMESDYIQQNLKQRSYSYTILKCFVLSRVIKSRATLNEVKKIFLSRVNCYTNTIFVYNIECIY